jgi:uncharacterized protein (TIGR03000 family)
MYSLIVMTALSGAPDVPEFGGLFRNAFSGCAGCYGSCVGRSAGCFGCVGGGFGSRLRAFFSFGGGSCYGSCLGRSYACVGMAHSCVGFAPGAGFDTYPPAGPGLGVPYAPPVPAIPGSAFLPTTAAPGCCDDGFALGAPAPAGDPYLPPFAPAAPMPAGPPASVPEDRDARRVTFVPSAAGADPTRGTVVVRLPADAVLYAEGRRLTLTSAERTFVTPPLPAGQEYTYTFRAEYVRDGETISQTRRVAVRPGGTAAVEFVDLTVAKGGSKPDPVPLTQPAAAQPAAAEPASRPASPFVGGPTPERARLTVKLPPGATLYVDGKKNERTEPVREFSTPPLPPGQEFAYLMKAEVLRDGRPETQLTKVTFRAGEMVTVDFTAAPGR